MTPNRRESRDAQMSDRSLSPAWKDELLDRELAPLDQAAAERRLLDEPGEREEFVQLQELDGTLRRVLSAGELNVADFLERLEERTHREQQTSAVSVVSVSSGMKQRDSLGHA